jgi:hypothetical protein
MRMEVRRADEVLFEVIDGTAVLVDPDGKELFTLNRVGSRVWDALSEHGDPSALADHLLPQLSGVTREQLESDIRAFLDELRTAGLVVDRA